MMQPALVLNYHEIAPGDSPYRYRLSAPAFEDHLRLVGAPAAPHAAPLRVTFDDGHASQHRHALPLLEKYSVKATFFVTAGWTGVAQDYMSWEQLAELIALGHRVQAHGWSHRFLTSCAGAGLEEELRRPRLALEDRLGIAVDSFSFPGGRWNRRVLEACRSAGYTAAFTSDPWPLEREVGGLRLFGRVGVTRSTTPAHLLRLRENGGRPDLPERLRHGATRALQGLLGDALYHRLWCLWARRNPKLEGTPMPRQPDS